MPCCNLALNVFLGFFSSNKYRQLKAIRYYILLLFLLTKTLIGQGTTWQKLGFQYRYVSLSEVKYSKVHTSDIYGSGIYSVAEFHFPHFSVVNSMFATTDSLEALKGGQHKVKCIFGYSNKAYLTFHGSISDVLFSGLVGRDYFKISYSKTSSLFLSNESRPFDQMRLSAKYKDFTGQIVGIQLNNLSIIRRYLAVHTLQWNYKEIINIQFGESLLYSGLGRSLEWQYFNPVLFWTPEMVNPTTDDGNGLLYAGISWYPREGLNLWGEFLLDDWQINHESIGDLEPNEYGLVVGVEKAAIDTSWFAWLEYTKITNRTYQTPDITETYTHRSFPLGHYLGNDFVMIQGRYEQKLPQSLISKLKWMSQGKAKFYADIAYIRDGANGLDTPFDTPWVDSAITLEIGYSEPIPTKPITYVTEIEGGLEYQFGRNSFVTMGLFMQRKERLGIVETSTALTFRLWMALDKTFKY